MKLFTCPKCGKSIEVLATEASHPCPAMPMGKYVLMDLTCRKHKMETDATGHRACLSCRESGHG